MKIQIQVFDYLVFAVFYLFFGVATSATQNATLDITSTTASNLSKSGDGTSGNVLSTASMLDIKPKEGMNLVIPSSDYSIPPTTHPMDVKKTSSVYDNSILTTETINHISHTESFNVNTERLSTGVTDILGKDSTTSSFQSFPTNAVVSENKDDHTAQPSTSRSNDKSPINLIFSTSSRTDITASFSMDRPTESIILQSGSPVDTKLNTRATMEPGSNDRSTRIDFQQSSATTLVRESTDEITRNHLSSTTRSDERTDMHERVTTQRNYYSTETRPNVGTALQQITEALYVNTTMHNTSEARTSPSAIVTVRSDNTTEINKPITNIPYVSTSSTDSSGEQTSDTSASQIKHVSSISSAIDTTTSAYDIVTRMLTGRTSPEQDMIRGMSTGKTTLEQDMTTGMPAGKATSDQNIKMGMSTERVTPDQDIFTGLSAGKTTLNQDTSTTRLTGETTPDKDTSTVMSTGKVTLDHDTLTMMSKETTTSPQEALSIPSKETTTDTSIPETDTNTGITLSPTKFHGNTTTNLPISNVSKDTTTDSTFTSASETNVSGTYTQTLPRDASSIIEYRVTTVSSYDNISETSTGTTKQVSNINTLNSVTGFPEVNVTNRPNDTVQPSLMPGRTSTTSGVQTTETFSGTDEVTDTLLLNTTSANTNVGSTLFSGHATTPMPLNNSKMVNNSILPSISTHEATLSQVSITSKTNVTPSVENTDVNGAPVPMKSYFSNVIVTSPQVTHIASDSKAQLISPTTSYNMAFSTTQTSTTQRAVTSDHMTSLGISNGTDYLVTAAHTTLISALNEITVLSLVTSQSPANSEVDLTSAVALTTVPNAHGSAYSVALSPSRTGSIAAEVISTRLPTEESSTVVEISLTSYSSPDTKESITTSSTTEVISTTNPSTIISSTASLSSEVPIAPTPSTVKSTTSGLLFGISSTRGATEILSPSSAMTGEITTSTLNIELSTYSSILEIHSSKSGVPTTERTSTNTAVTYRTTADVISTSLLTSMNLNIISPTTPITTLLKSSFPTPASTTAMISSSSSAMSNGLSSISIFASVIPTKSSPAAGIPALSSRTTGVPTSASTSNASTPSGPVAGIPTTSNSTPRTPTTVTSRLVSPLTVSPAKLGTSSHPMSRTSTPASKTSGACDGNPCGPLYNCVEDNNSYQCTLGAAFIVSVVLPLGILLVVVIALLVCVVVLLRRSLEKSTSGANDSNEADRNTQNNELIEKQKDDGEKSTDQLECNGLPPVVAPTMPVIGDVVKKPVLAPIWLQGTSDPTVNMVNETAEESADRKRHKKKKRKERKRKDEELSDLNTSPSNAIMDEPRVPADVPMMLDATLHSEESAPKKKKHKKHKNKSEKSKMHETPDLDETVKQQPMETEDPLNGNPYLVSNQKIQEAKVPTDVSPVDDQIMSGESDVKKKTKKHKKHKSKKYKIHPLPLNDTEIDTEPPLINVAVPLQESENGVDKKVVNTEQATENMEVIPPEERSPRDDVTLEQEPTAPEEVEESVVNTEPVSERMQTGSQSNLINDENGLEDEKTEMAEIDQCDENSVPIEDETTFTNNDRKESKDDELFYKRDQDKEKVKTPMAVSPAIYRELVKRQRKINITHRYATMDV